MSLWKLLGFGSCDESTKTPRGQLYAALGDLLRGRSDDEIKWITGVAGLLGTVANADAVLEPSELRRIRELVQRELHLSPEQTGPIVALLERHRVQLLAVEDYHYARLVNEQATRERKRELLHLLFDVAAADGTITSDEENAVRRISQTLGLDHQDFIEARLAFKNLLSVFQNSSP